MAKKTCYYCGGEATTKEHVPPKQMFKAFNCDSITVPSCVIHNCSKGGDDQAIVSVLLTSLKNYNEWKKEDNSIISFNVRRAIRMASKSFNRTKNKISSRPFLDNMPTELEPLPDSGFLKSPIKVKNWIKNLTAAIFYDGVKEFDSSIEWEKLECWSPEHVDSKYVKTSNDKLELLKEYNKYKTYFDSKTWIDGWSAHPRKYPKDIYSFFFCFEFGDVTIKHNFYNSYNWYASFSPSENLLLKLKAKLRI